jgi:sugar-specific transcriptional regulator TrmB
VDRLTYEAQRAERQYNHVDPENRLIAASLEKKWEQALQELEQARVKLEAAQRDCPSPLVIPADLREAFSDAGKRLPELWPRLSAEAQKSLLRTLVHCVNVYRQPEGVVQLRIVWRGGLVTERQVRVPVRSISYSETDKKVAERIRSLTTAGFENPAIATQLNAEGLVPCRGQTFTPQIVAKIKRRYNIVSNFTRGRRGSLPFAFTVSEVARRLRVHYTWIYDRINDGRIRLQKNPTYRCYLFPRNQQVIQELRQLKKGTIHHVTIPEVHCDG